MDSEAPEAFHSGDPLFTFDTDLRILSWNPAAEELTGVPPEEALGCKCWQVLGGLDEDGGAVCHAGCSYARLAREGWPVPCHELLVRTASRRRRRVALSTIEVSGNGRRLFLHVMHEPPQKAPRGPIPTLTPRQHEVLELLAAGVPAKLIALRLGLAEATVRNHVRAIRQELGVHSQLEAVAKARRHGLVAA